MNENFISGSDAVIIVYSIDMPSSFKSLSDYYERVERNCRPLPIIVFAGNKCDLDGDRRVKN